MYLAGRLFVDLQAECTIASFFSSEKVLYHSYSGEMNWWVACCPLTLLPHINTRDCLEVCAIIILKPAGMVYMYQPETVTSIETNADLHI